MIIFIFHLKIKLNIINFRWIRFIIETITKKKTQIYYKPKLKLYIVISSNILKKINYLDSISKTYINTNINTTVIQKLNDYILYTF